MKRDTWLLLHHVARHLRATGEFPDEVKNRCKYMGGGVEKAAYLLYDAPDWVIKMGGGRMHTPEHETEHKIPPEHRPVTFHYPLRTSHDQTYVQIQERVRLLSRTPAFRWGTWDMIPKADRDRLSRFQDRMRACGIHDQHPSNVGLTLDGRMVTIDWGMIGPLEPFRLHISQELHRSTDELSTAGPISQDAATAVSNGFVLHGLLQRARNRAARLFA